jgi:hypothetical protein
VTSAGGLKATTCYSCFFLAARSRKSVAPVSGGELWSGAGIKRNGGRLCRRPLLVRNQVTQPGRAFGRMT